MSAAFTRVVNIIYPAKSVPPFTLVMRIYKRNVNMISSLTALPLGRFVTFFFSEAKRFILQTYYAKHMIAIKPVKLYGFTEKLAFYEKLL